MFFVSICDGEAIFVLDHHFLFWYGSASSDALTYHHMGHVATPYKINTKNKTKSPNRLPPPKRFQDFITIPTLMNSEKEK